MNANVDLQVWLETNADTRPSIVTPYVQSAEDAHIHYRLYAIKKGKSGMSSVSQSGTVNVPAQKPTPLSRMSLSMGQTDACQIELILAKGGVPAGTYHFDCPP